jgi:aspartate aminotransferase
LQAEDIVRASNLDKEYLPITGLPEFAKNAAILAYGAGSDPIRNGVVSSLHPRFLFRHSIYFQVSVTQSISGTGALRIGAAFVARHYSHSNIIYVPTPTWGNHSPVFRDSGLEVRYYQYFDKNTVGLNFEGLKADLEVRELTVICY